MKKIHFVFLLCISIIIGNILVTNKLYNKLQRLETAFVEYHNNVPSKKEVYSLYEAYAIEPIDCKISDGKEHHILCLGNSITKHGYNDSIGWKSDWGMAASSEQKDYCHVLGQIVTQYNMSSSVTPLNIANWERDLLLNIDSLLSEYIVGKDVIIIRLGENVQDKELFRTSILRLVQYCQTKTKNVIITGCFWKDKDKEISIINAAHQCHIKYIPLYWLSELYPEEIYPKEGDTLRDIHGKLYNINGNFITTHPNDEGMKRIAETIFENIK